MQQGMNSARTRVHQPFITLFSHWYISIIYPKHMTCMEILTRDICALNAMCARAMVTRVHRTNGLLRCPWLAPNKRKNTTALLQSYCWYCCSDWQILVNAVSICRHLLHEGLRPMHYFQKIMCITRILSVRQFVESSMKDMIIISNSCLDQRYMRTWPLTPLHYGSD